MVQWHSASVKKEGAPAPQRRRITARAKSIAPNGSYTPPAIRDSLTIQALKDAAEMWLLDGDARLSPKTMVDRRCLLTKLMWWLECDKCDKCGKLEMLRFFAYLRTAHESPEGRWGEPGKPSADYRAHQELRPRTAANYFRWLRTFFAYSLGDGVLDVSPLKTLKPPVHRDDQIQPFTAKQIESLLSAAKKCRNSVREEAIILLLLDTGARASEICGLSVSDFNTSERTIRVKGKGNTFRVLHLTPRTTRAIVTYLRLQTRELEDPLFVAGQSPTSGQELTPNGLGKIIRRLGAESHLEGVRCSPHTFRHTFAVEFLRNGGDPLTLQSLYGHTSLEMTQKYVLFSQSDRKAKHGQFSPVAKMKLK